MKLSQLTQKFVKDMLSKGIVSITNCFSNQDAIKLRNQFIKQLNQCRVVWKDSSFNKKKQNKISSNKYIDNKDQSVLGSVAEAENKLQIVIDNIKSDF